VGSIRAVGERTEHVPGTFSWVECATSDLDGATAFYEGLLGWGHADTPIDESSVYRMFQVGGKSVAAAFTQREEERSHGIPPHWNNYVTVSSADDAASRIGELGGNVLVDPFDVFTAGRMVVFSDPTGAIVSLWEARESIGAEVVNEPGTLTWNELATTDVDKAKSFFSDLLGWTYDDVGTDETPYTTIRNGGRMNGGMRPLADQEKQMGVPPNWTPYFVSADIEKDATRIGELGGGVVAGPMSVLAGSKIAVARDPQGAVFALFEGETED
jgi:predicted enzyme related to lactoylglutathione lyase